jgi:asparagine synthase (glutamine-hydrolysing)
MAPDARYRSYLQVLDDETIGELLAEVAADGDDPLAAAFAAAGDRDEMNRMLAVDAETQLPDDLLLLTDKMSMAVSLECRVPFLDHALVELAASIPAAAKVPGGRLKHLLKEALADVLPADILNRGKRGFGTPMGAWLKRELAPMMGELLSPATLRARGLFRPAAVERLMAAHAADRTDATDALLALINLEVWSRIHLDRRTPDDVAAELKDHLA